MLGVDFRWNFLKKFSFYSQFMLDEFKTSEYFGKKGSWGKKFGFQAGLKYIDAFKIPNLDLQAELNLARPYTYAQNRDTPTMSIMTCPWRTHLEQIFGKS